MQGGLKEEHEPDSGQCWEADRAASLAQGEVRQAEAGGGSTVCPLVLRAQVTSSHGRGCRPRDSGVCSGEHRTDLDLNSTIEGRVPPTSSFCVSGVPYRLPKTM